MSRPVEREPASPRKTYRNLPKALRLFLLAILVLSGVSAAVELGQHLAGNGYPYDWPFVAPASRFDDLLDWLPRYASLHTEAFFHQPDPIVYPAPMSMLYGAWRLLGRGALPAYLLLAAVTAALGALLVFRKLREYGFAPLVSSVVFLVLLGTSYPFWFVVYTANFELVVFLLLGCGLFCFCHNHPRLAAAFIGVAVALKWTPMLFFLLFLNRRHWQSFLTGTVTTLSVTLASLWGVYPNISQSWHQTRLGMATFVRRDGLHILPGQLGFDHSLLALIKFLLPTLSPAQFTGLWTALFPLLASVLVALWFLRVRRQPLAEQVLFLATAMVLFPPVSYDYTLLSMYLPGALLLGTTLHRQPDAADVRMWLTVGCFAVVLTAQGYVVLAGDHRGAQVKAIALITLFCLSASGKRHNLSAQHSHYLQPC